MADELKYTPSPWQLEEGEQYKIVAGAEQGGFGVVIAEVMNHEDIDETISNAKLIALAPEMYETLKGLLKIAKKQLSIVEDEPAKMALGFMRDQIKGSLSKLK